MAGRSGSGAAGLALSYASGWRLCAIRLRGKGRHDHTFSISSTTIRAREGRGGRARVIPRRRTGPTSPLLRKPPWIRVKAPGSAGLGTRPAALLRETRAHDRLRGGGLPQHRRVLGEEARHLHDHGRDLHARLRLLQCRHRPARRGSTRTSRPGSPKRRRSSACRMWSSPRSIATISTTAAPGISREPSRAIRAACPATTIEVLTPDFLRKHGALETRRRGAARRVQPQSRDRAVALSDGAAGRALFPFAAAAAARQGTATRRSSPSPG